MKAAFRVTRLLLPEKPRFARELCNLSSIVLNWLRVSGRVRVSISLDSDRGAVVVSVKAKAHAEVGSGTIVVSVESTVEAEVGSVVSFEDAVNSEVGGSSGEGVEEISESQNINGDLSGTRSSPIAAGRVISLEDGIFRRLSDGRRRGAALVPSWESSGLVLVLVATTPS